MRNKIASTISIAALMLASCSGDFLDVESESHINSEQLGSSTAGTLGTLQGIYSGLRSYGIAVGANHEDYGHKAVLSALDLMGNDVVMENLNWHGFNYNYTGRVLNNSRTRLIWNTYYIQIKNANILINSVDPTISDELKAYRGQALAIRGYFHFMLARTFGPTYVGNTSAACIPINTGTTADHRNTVQEVYDQIIADLEESITALDGYTRANKEFIDKSVAQAFLADVYLETGNYAKAAELANAARQGYTLLSETDYKNGFYQIDQNETMWGADITSELSTWVANFFSHFDNTNEGYAEGGNISIDKRLYDAIPATDYRKDLFMGATEGVYSGDGKTYGPYISFKYRDLTTQRTDGDYIYLRSAAMYYIEAEALARTGDEAGARQVLYDITSNRDSGYVLSTNSGQALIDEIILQKRIELWGEGFGWFDLKRLKLPVIRIYTDSNHSAFGQFDIPVGDARFLFQIPQTEVDANPGVLPNNP